MSKKDAQLRIHLMINFETLMMRFRMQCEVWMKSMMIDGNKFRIQIQEMHFKN